jgi:hypothetical protein
MVPTVMAACVCASATGSTAATPSGTFSGCPRHPLPLPASAAAYASDARKAALRFVHGDYLRLARTHHWHLKVAGARTTRVLRVRHWLPSGWIKSECGLAVWRRSLAVGVYFPAMDPPHNPLGHCNDCAGVTFLLSKRASGWTVWGNY